MPHLVKCNSFLCPPAPLMLYRGKRLCAFYGFGLKSRQRSIHWPLLLLRCYVAKKKSWKKFGSGVLSHLNLATYIGWWNFVFVFVLANMGCKGAKENASNRGLLFPRPEHQGLNVCNVHKRLLPFLRSPQPQGVWSWSMFAKSKKVPVGSAF